MMDASRPLLPHMPPMHWLDGMTLTDTGVQAWRRITADHPFVHAGQLLPSALIELMAQAAAAGAIAQAQRQSRHLRQGYLAAIKEFQILAPLPVESTVTLEAREETTFGAWTQSYLQARISDSQIAWARMTFHLEFE